MAIKQYKSSATGCVVTVDSDDAWQLGEDYEAVKASKKEKEDGDGGNSGSNRRDESAKPASGSGRANPGSKTS